MGRSVVVDADGVLVAGNGVASVLPNDTPVRVIETDGTELVVVKRTDLHTDDEKRKLLALADNATSDNVEWDMEAMEADGWDADSAGEWGVDWPADDEENGQVGKNTEIDTDNFDDKIKIEFELTIEEHAFVRDALAKIDANKEIALLKLLGYGEE